MSSPTTERPRLRQRAGGKAASPGKEIERRTADQKALAGRVQRMEAVFARAMPTGLEARQLVRAIVTCVRETPDLWKCDPDTLLGAGMTCAQLGFLPGSALGDAWILPFYDNRNGRFVATFVAGYRGLTQLAYRHPSVTRVDARAVFEGDAFDVDYGGTPRLLHRPAPNRRVGRPLVAAYGVVNLHGDGPPLFVDMTKDELNWWREEFAPRGRPPEGGGVRPIIGNWAEPDASHKRQAMEIKTPLRRLLGRNVPRSVELVRVLQVDGGVRRETDPEAPAEDVTEFLEGSEVPAITDGAEAEQPRTP